MRLESNYSSFPPFSGHPLQDIHEFNLSVTSESNESFELHITGIREIGVIRWLNNPSTTAKPFVSIPILNDIGLLCSTS